MFSIRQKRVGGGERVLAQLAHTRTRRKKKHFWHGGRKILSFIQLFRALALFSTRASERARATGGIHCAATVAHPSPFPFPTHSVCHTRMDANARQGSKHRASAPRTSPCPNSSAFRPNGALPRLHRRTSMAFALVRMFECVQVSQPALSFPLSPPWLHSLSHVPH